MKNLALAATFIVMAATFATSGFAADAEVGKSEASAEITFVNKQKKRSAYVTQASLYHGCCCQ